MIATTTVHLETHAMLLIDCPLCDAPAAFDTRADCLDCPRCAVRLELAADDAPELAAAA